MKNNLLRIPFVFVTFQLMRNENYPSTPLKPFELAYGEFNVIQNIYGLQDILSLPGGLLKKGTTASILNPLQISSMELRIVIN